MHLIFLYCYRVSYSFMKYQHKAHSSLYGVEELVRLPTHILREFNSTIALSKEASHL